MSDEMERAKEIDSAVKAADAKKRANAEAAAETGEKPDKVLANLDALGKRMDAYEDAARGKDDEGEDEIERDKPKELAADSQMVRKDSAADVEEVEHFKAEHGATYKVEADAILAYVQADADRASSAWGKSAKQPWDGESVTAYRRRVAREHQQYSPAWKNVDLSVLSGQETQRSRFSRIRSRQARRRILMAMCCARFGVVIQTPTI